MSSPQPTFAAGGEVSSVNFAAQFPRGVTTWKEAEQLGLALMHYLGYGDAALTKSGSDGGIDVLSRDACCQVKHWDKTVGRQDLQRLAGAATGRCAVFLARSYSTHARSWAEPGDVALFAYDLRANVDAINAKAISLATRGHYGGTTERGEAALVRLKRAGRWLAIAAYEAERVDRFSSLPRRERKRAVKELSAALDRAGRANAAVARAGERGTIDDLERALADMEFHVRRAASILQLHLPE